MKAATVFSMSVVAAATPADAAPPAPPVANAKPTPPALAVIVELSVAVKVTLPWVLTTLLF